MPEPFKTCLKRLVAIWIVGQIAGAFYHRKPMLRLAVARPRGILQPLKIALVLRYVHFSAIPFPVFVVKMAAPTGAASVVVKWLPHPGRLALTSSSRFLSSFITAIIQIQPERFRCAETVNRSCFHISLRHLRRSRRGTCSFRHVDGPLLYLPPPSSRRGFSTIPRTPSSSSNSSQHVVK